MRCHDWTADLARIVTEYHERALEYYDFLATMHNILVSLLHEQGVKYQISQRLKSVDSIREKIARNARTGKVYRQLSDVEDVAGIRIVFLLESDKRRFLAALLDELTRERLSLEDHRKASGYRATHVLAQLGRKRLSLQEYRRFAGLKCEIQLTSALYHAWSEIEHDILYKRNGHSKPLPPATAKALERQLAGALRDHLERAGDMLEVAAARARRARARRHVRPSAARR
jgi:ppGpp synthetase/RelA/SpoT-type nucleotidyltranferase